MLELQTERWSCCLAASFTQPGARQSKACLHRVHGLHRKELTELLLHGGDASSDQLDVVGG